jgi:hypothetical protein
MYGYMHFYLGMTMMQAMSFMLRSLYKKTNIPFPRSLAGPQESSKRFRKEENVFPAQESNLGISVQSIAPQLCFTSGTLYRGGKSLGTHRTGGSVAPTADLKTMAK